MLDGSRMRRFPDTESATHGVGNRSGRRACDPVVRPRCQHCVDLRRRYRPRLRIVASYQCRTTPKWGNEESVCIAKAARWGTETVRNTPSDWAFANDEERSFGRPEREPAKSWEPTNLKVIGLNVRAFKKIGALG